MNKYEIAERIRDLVVFEGKELIEQIYSLADKVERDNYHVACEHSWKFYQSVAIDPPYEKHTYMCTKCGATHTEEINVYGM